MNKTRLYVWVLVTLEFRLNEQQIKELFGMDFEMLQSCAREYHFGDIIDRAYLF